MFGEPVAKREIHTPSDPSHHPELDTTPLCDPAEIKNYWEIIGELKWAVSLGRIDIMCATVTMASLRPAPRKGHLYRLKQIYQYLRNYKKTAIKSNVEIPNNLSYYVIKANCGQLYHPCKEEIPSNTPRPKGKPVTFVHRKWWNVQTVTSVDTRTTV